MPFERPYRPILLKEGNTYFIRPTRSLTTGNMVLLLQERNNYFIMKGPQPPLPLAPPHPDNIPSPDSIREWNTNHQLWTSIHCNVLHYNS